MDKLKELLAPGTPIPKKSTVAKFLALNQLHIIKAVKKPFISDSNKAKRVSFALRSSRSDTALNDLVNNTIWSDETTVKKMPKDKNIYIRCHASTPREELTINHQIQMGGFSVMFWGCFSARGLGPLVALEGSQNQETYIQLLKEYVLPEIKTAKDEFGVDLTFMQDNAPCHKAHSVTQFLAEKGIKTLDWPAQSPDLNPIEHFWAIIKGRRQKKIGFPKTAAELIDQIFDTWENLEPSIIHNLAESIKNRLKEVIRLKGSATKY